jgi:D-glycero-alpha-D-manno-heptose-7-phosphate kinase
LYAEGREETLLGMKRLQEMAYAMRDAVERADLPAVGTLLHDAFVAKQQMNPYITEDTPIESMLAAAHDAGAYGAKVCGAGGGGYLLVAAAPEVQPNVRSALEAMGGEFAPFAFAPTGVRATRGEAIWAPES